MTELGHSHLQIRRGGSGFIPPLGAVAATFIAIAFTGVVITSAQTREFPSKNVTLMMPYAAGGPGDTLTRIIGQGMGTQMRHVERGHAALVFMSGQREAFSAMR